MAKSNKYKGLDFYDKTKILSTLKKIEIKPNDIHYLSELIGINSFLNERNPKKYSEDDVLSFLVEQVIKNLTENYSNSLFHKLIYSTVCFINRHLNCDEITEEEYDNLNELKENEFKDMYKDKRYFVTTTPLDESLYLEIKKIKPLYEKFKDENRDKYFNNKDEEETLDILVKEIEEMIEKVVHHKTGELEQYDKNINDNGDLELLQSLNDTINEQKKIISNLEKTIDNLTAKITRLEKNESQLKNNLQETKQELNNLQVQYNLLLNNYKISKENDKIIFDLKQKIEDLEKLLEEKIIEISTIKKEIKKNADDMIIKDIIIRELQKNNLTIDNLIDLINLKGYHISRQELYHHIKELQLIFNIDINETFCGTSKYTIRSQSQSNYKFDLNCPNSKSINLLFISNLLLTDSNENIYRIIDYIYNYCINNSITNIFNIGNILNFNTPINFEQIKVLKETLAKISTDYPQDNSINNFFLGGTHDLTISKCGFNPIRYLCNERYDFINLGYVDAKVRLNFPENSLYLHQPIEVSTKLEQREKIIDLIQRKQNVLNIFGSNYTSIFDVNNNFITIPPIYHDEYLNGATHIKISLNSVGDIEEILCIPLIKDDKILPTSHIYLKK